MTPERWQQIDQLFHAALACQPVDRTQFLANACGDDESLRLEVESLISSHEEAQSFIETPAGDIAAEMLGLHEYGFAPGDQIANYKILRQLGSGGMGEVYLADDLRLKRKIALKVLPLHFTVNPDRVRRFEREARASSALNHPNIVTIYEVGESNSAHFIATEFVDGKTLRQLISEKPFKLRESINVALQVASALSAAHSAGIVHRDIKPENIVIRTDGLVKILDFGLAKLTDMPTTSADLETPTLLQSNPGLVMGTVQYMSPEQARGINVDSRTDIWSLGIVLYELLAGRVPFSGETPSHIMVSLMEDELPPLTDYANVPAELGRIVIKALRKNQTERHQTADQIARELRKLKEELQLAHLRGALETVPSKEKTAKHDSKVDGNAIGSAARTVDAGVAYSTSSAEYVAGGIKRHKTLAVVALFALLIGATGLSYFVKERIKTNGSQPSLIAKRGTMNEEAYRYYLQGKNLTNQRNAEGDRKAIENFEQAIRLDPNYARAYAGMANAYHSLGIHDGLPRVENEKAKRAIEKALELDSNLAEAYAVRGIIDFAYDWDFAASEQDLLRGIELEPNNDTAHWGYALLLAYRGHFDRALKEIEIAQMIAPGTAMYERDRGRILYYSRHYDEAIVQLKRTLELKGDLGSASSWLRRTYEMKGEYAAAFETFIKSRKDPERIEAYRKAYETIGWQGVMRQFLEFSKLDEQKPGSNLYEIGILSALLGDKDQAFGYLNEAAEKHQWEVAMLNVDPQLDSLRGDPRFDELVRRVGLK